MHGRLDGGSADAGQSCNFVDRQIAHAVSLDLAGDDAEDARWPSV